MDKEGIDSGRPQIARRHQLVGWWSLLVFVALGLVLEGLHGLKVGWYLNVTNETRRLMWTLAHAHGTLLGLINVVFGLVVATARAASGLRLASVCLMAATVLLPAGFLLGGIWIHAGDPGLGILLVPLGGLFLVVGILGAAINASR